MTTNTRTDVAAGLAALTVAAALLWTLIPFGLGQQSFPALDNALILVAGLLASLAVLAAISTTLGPPRDVPRRLEAMTLWFTCGVALLAAFGAVSASTQSFNLEYVVQAQANTSLFVLVQPVAASVYLVAVALAAQAPAAGSLLGPPTRERLLAELAMLSALSGLGATLFLAGFSGRALPGPVWLLLKTLAMAALLLFMRRRLSGLSSGARMAIAWTAAMVGLLNLAITFALVPR